jgi:hypothetical protein
MSLARLASKKRRQTSDSGGLVIDSTAIGCTSVFTLQRCGIMMVINRQSSGGRPGDKQATCWLGGWREPHAVARSKGRRFELIEW